MKMNARTVLLCTGQSEYLGQVTVTILLSRLAATNTPRPSQNSLYTSSARGLELAARYGIGLLSAAQCSVHAQEANSGKLERRGEHPAGGGSGLACHGRGGHQRPLL